MPYGRSKRTSSSTSPVKTFRRVAIVSALLILTGTVVGTTPSAGAGDAWTAHIVTASVPEASVPSYNVVPIPVSSVAPIGAPGTPASPVKINSVLNRPTSIAMTPDGKTSFVLGANEVHIVRGGAVNKTIPLPAQPQAIAITPDGKTAWITTINPNSQGMLVPVDTAALTAGKTVPLNFAPGAIAITPSGKVAYLASRTNGGVFPFDLTTLAVGPAAIPAGNNPSAMAIKPDGSTLYVVFTGNSDVDGWVTPVNTANNTPGPVIKLGTSGSRPHPVAVAMSPNGDVVYVADQWYLVIRPIDTATNTTKPTIDAGTNPNAIAVTPDGNTAYVTTDRCWVQLLDLVKGTQAQRVNLSSTCSTAVAITPDQAPVASFTIDPQQAGKATGFDGTASTTQHGTIVRYDWDFGDSKTATTNTPQTTHVYATAGDYNVTLTVTNSAGTSLEQRYTGQMMIRNGGPSARKSLPVKIPPPTTSSSGTTGSTAGTVPKQTTVPKPTDSSVPGQTTQPGQTTLPGQPGQPGQPAQPGQPVLQASPPIGPPGTVVHVTGSGFAPNADVLLSWQPGIGTVPTKTNGSGQIDTYMLVLPKDVLGPRVVRTNTNPVATAPFHVVPASVQPGGADHVVKFRG